MNASRRMISLMTVLMLLFAPLSVLAKDNDSKERVRISIGELKRMLGNPDLLVIDARDPISWDKSDLKIAGAVREDPMKLEQWAEKYPKNKTIVFYCA